MATRSGLRHALQGLDVRWIGLTGPTACGKSSVALRLAQELPVEIISVDSALVYRSMDIGTAKPNPAERADVPHHLIDIRDPLDAYSAAAFVRDAQALIDAIHARGRLPLLVGGTMLYFRALMLGLDDMPPADAQLRAGIETEAAKRGWPALHVELAGVDPITAARLAPNDSQRIQRALEVWRLTGRPLSAWQTQHSKAPNAVTDDGADALLISLEPQSRPWLHQRIEQRFDAMLAAGFLDEVRALMARGDLHPDLPSMRCVGYRQAWEALTLGDLSPLRDKAVAATRQLAKRQITWLRSMPQRCVVASDGDADRVFQSVKDVALGFAKDSRR